MLDAAVGGGGEGLREGLDIGGEGVEVGGAGGGVGAVGEGGEAVAALGQEAVDRDGGGGRLVDYQTLINPPAPL